MSIEYKRTVSLFPPFKDGDEPLEHSQRMPDGSVQYNIHVANGKDASHYCCALELSGCSFHYIPDTREILYIISRMRSRYKGGHTPENTSVCDVWVNGKGSVWVRIGLARINVYGSDHESMTYSQRQEWRDYVVSCIEDKLIEAEEGI